MYNCSEFLEKNDDSMAAEIEQVLLRSTQPLIAAACAPPAVPETPAAEQGKHHKGERGGGSGGHSSFGSVGAKFVKSLRELMAELGSADAHFVRCVKPNAELVPLKLHGEDVVNQLRMSGMLDAVKLIQAGYPTRIPYEALAPTLALSLTRLATPRAYRTKPSTRATRASSRRRYSPFRPPSSPKFSPACATCGHTRTS